MSCATRHGAGPAPAATGGCLPPGLIALGGVLLTAAAVYRASSQMHSTVTSCCATCRWEGRSELLWGGLWLAGLYGSYWWLARLVAPGEARAILACAAGAAIGWGMAVGIALGWLPVF